MKKNIPEPADDTANYDAAKTHLKNAFEHMLAAGRNAREFGAYAVDKFGDTYLPHLRRFLADLDLGQIRVKGLGKEAKAALFGTPVTADERAEMIRVAAYLRAERRGFTNGSPEEDWLAAEREVDRHLALMAGLVTRGQLALGAATAAVEQELGDLKKNVSAWLEDTGRTKHTTQKAPARRKSESPAP